MRSSDDGVFTVGYFPGHGPYSHQSYAIILPSLNDDLFSEPIENIGLNDVTFIHLICNMLSRQPIVNNYDRQMNPRASFIKRYIRYFRL